MLNSVQKAVVSAVAATALVVGGGAAAITNAAVSSSGATVQVAPASSFPDATTTGYAVGTVLKSNPALTITKCGTYTDLTVNGDIDIAATNGTKVDVAGESIGTPCVVIQDSLVEGSVDSSYTSSSRCGSSPCGPTLIEDTEIAHNLATDANVKETNLYLLRVNEHGGRTGVLCDGFCLVKDSIIHDNYFVGTAHMGGTLSNGNGGNPIKLDHDTVQCNTAAGSPGGSGGCSADVNFYGDFAAISNVSVINTYLRASTGNFYYCAYSGAKQTGKAFPTGNNINFTNDVFEPGQSGKCGDAGPVADWQGGNGNVWCNNRYLTGALVSASDETCAVAPVTTSTVKIPPTTAPITLPPPPSTTTSTASPVTTTTQAPVTTTTTVPVTTTTLCSRGFTTSHGDRVCQTG